MGSDQSDGHWYSIINGFFFLINSKINYPLKNWEKKKKKETKKNRKTKKTEKAVGNCVLFCI